MNLSVLEKYCKGTAESEDGAGVLEDIFHDTGIITRIFNFLPGSPQILLGHKGTGKTIILKEIEKILSSHQLDVLYLTPAQITGQQTPAAEDSGVLQDFYYSCLIKQVAVALGEQMEGLLGKNDALLLNEAIKNGNNDTDLISSICDFLSKIGKVITDRDISTITKNPHDVPVEKLFRLITNNLRSNKLFVLMIDEPDDIMIEGSTTKRIWGLLNAVRMFSAKLPNARVIVSLRSEIWNLLLENDIGSKNIDHFSTLVVPLDPTDDEIREVLKKRLKFIAKECNLQEREGYDVFFDGHATLLPPPAQGETSIWADYFVKHSRNRSRDGIQFIRELALNAMRNKREKINSTDVISCATAFSESRAKLLSKEYALDYPNLLHTINEFAKLKKFSIPTDEMKKFFSSVLGNHPQIIRGKRLTSSVEGNIYVIWKIFHEMGFINPCIPDDREKRGFRHILFCDDNNFVSQMNLNQMNLVLWDIHPAYRSYLYSLTDNELHRDGWLKRRKAENKSNFKQKRKKY